MIKHSIKKTCFHCSISTKKKLLDAVEVCFFLYFCTINNTLAKIYIHFFYYLFLQFHKVNHSIEFSIALQRTENHFFLTCAVCNCKKTTAMCCMCLCSIIHLSCGELGPGGVLLPAAGLGSALHSEKVEAPHQLVRPTDDITLCQKTAGLRRPLPGVWLQSQCCSCYDLRLGHDCHQPFKHHLSSTGTPTSTTLA